MQVSTIGFDIAKNVFQIHGIDASERVVFNKPLRRSQVLPFLAKIPPCLIGMEACASPNTWLHPNASLRCQIPLAMRAPSSIFGTAATATAYCLLWQLNAC